MYPYIRFGQTIVNGLVQAVKGQRLKLTDTSEIHFRASVTDIDNFFEMNNGRILTLFDLGRTDLTIRTGLGKKLLRHGWGVVVAGSSIQYRKRVRWHDPITIKTRLVGIDARWIYIEQTMWVKGHATSMVLIRAGVTNFATGKVIATDKVLDAIGLSGFEMPPEAWVQAWIEADKLRPYPEPVSDQQDQQQNKQ